MIDALISGKLIKTPVRKIGQSGKPFCNFIIRVNQYDSEDTTLCSGIAFGESAEKIARLVKDDPLTVVGQAKLSEWTAQDGSKKHGLNVTVSNCLSAYEVSKRRGTASTSTKATTSQSNQDDFDDGIPFQ